MPVDEEVESQHMKFIQSPPRKFLMLQEHQGGLRLRCTFYVNGLFMLTDISRLSAGYCMYTLLNQDRCEPCLAQLWIRAERSLHSLT